MPTSKVYFTDLRTQIGVSQLDKLEKLKIIIKSYLIFY